MKPDLDALLSENSPSRLVSFRLEFRSGDEYDHSYLVPEAVILKGDEAVREYIIMKALGDIVYVELEED